MAVVVWLRSGLLVGGPSADAAGSGSRRRLVSRCGWPRRRPDGLARAVVVDAVAVLVHRAVAAAWPSPGRLTGVVVAAAPASPPTAAPAPASSPAAGTRVAARRRPRRPRLPGAATGRSPAPPAAPPSPSVAPTACEGGGHRLEEGLAADGAVAAAAGGQADRLAVLGEQRAAAVAGLGADVGLDEPGDGALGVVDGGVEAE